MNTDTKPEPATEPAEPDENGQKIGRSTVWEMANIIAGCGDFPDCRTPEKAAVRIMAGAEIGIGPMAAIAGLRIEKGRISTSAAIFESIIDRSKIYNWKLKERTDQAAEIEFFRDGESRGTIRYTLADAKKAGILHGDNWQKHPAAMLFAAAFRTGARAFCAGAFNGNAVYGYEELGYRVNENGDLDEAGGGGNGAANDLCTRDQRQEISRLVEAAGKSMPGFLAESHIRLLDELSGYEAAKAIKKLQKLAAKKQASGTPASSGNREIPPMQQAPVPETPGPGVQMLMEAKAEADQPSTPQQHQRIYDLAEKLEPASENEQRELVIYLLGKYAGQTPDKPSMKAASHLACAAMIEAMERKAGEPPFDAGAAVPR